MANITKGGISTTEKILPSDEKKTKDFLPVQTKHERKLSDYQKEKMKKGLDYQRAKRMERQRKPLYMERFSGAGYSGTEDYKQ